MVIAIIVVILVILVIVLFTIIKQNRHNRGDYRDGGGTQVGGNQRIPFFTPANDRAGMWGEKVANYHLRPLLRGDEYLLVNLLIPLKYGGSIEIDSVIISRKGIFCIETKHWVGHIRGNDEDEFWFQIYDDPAQRDREHRNPIKQNEGHCKALDRITGHKYEIDNIVIFVDLEDWRGIDSNHVYTVSGFKSYYRDLMDDELTIDEVKTIFKILSQYIANPEELEQHRQEVKQRYNNFN